MTSKERIHRQATGREVDRIPSIGGWMHGVENLSQIARITTDAYLRDPEQGVVLANLALGADAMVSPVIPTEVGQIRSGHVTEADFDRFDAEDLLEKANQLPDSEKELLKNFDTEAHIGAFESFFKHARESWRGLEIIPNFWDLGGHFPLYTEFGYTAFLTACSLYPAAVEKLWWAKSVVSRERAKILIPLFREYDLPPLLFCGEDLCTNHGPMVSPEMLRKHYFPTVRMIVEPLVDAGIRLIHHCDGDVRPLLDDFLDMGFSGLQGFQYEVGIDLFDLAQRKSLLGDPLLLFTGLSVSRTLPLGTIDDVCDEVDYFIDATDGGKRMFLFTSNVAGVEVPPENLVAGYRRIQDAHSSHGGQHRPWPWAEKYRP